MPTLTIRTPTLETMREVATELGFANMSDDDLRLHMKMLEGNFAAYNTVDQMPDEVPEVRYPRTPGRRPPPDENPHGAWYVKTTVEGARSEEHTSELQSRQYLV